MQFRFTKAVDNLDLMEPLAFQPILKQARWGGRALGDLLAKPIGTETDYAESWELAHQPHAESIVSGGEFDGTPLSDLIRGHSQELFGYDSPNITFPLLFKFLDANDWLSLQVHPDDQQAQLYLSGAKGKTEAWVIIDAQPDSQICAGFREPTDRKTVEHHLRTDSIEEILHYESVKAGDCVFIPAGTVHALGPGLVLAEIQQQSDLTFRLSDWGRLGTDGLPRELHIEQALDCLDYSTGPVSPISSAATSELNQTDRLVTCKYFTLKRHILIERCELSDSNRCRALMVVDGEGTIDWGAGSRDLKLGQTLLLPAAMPTASLIPVEKCTVLEIELS